MATCGDLQSSQQLGAQPFAANGGLVAWARRSNRRRGGPGAARVQQQPRCHAGNRVALQQVEAGLQQHALHQQQQALHQQQQALHQQQQHLVDLAVLQPGDSHIVVDPAQPHHQVCMKGTVHPAAAVAASLLVLQPPPQQQSQNLSALDMGLDGAPPPPEPGLALPPWPPPPPPPPALPLQPEDHHLQHQEQQQHRRHRPARPRLCTPLDPPPQALEVPASMSLGALSEPLLRSDSPAAGGVHLDRLLQDVVQSAGDLRQLQEALEQALARQRRHAQHAQHAHLGSALVRLLQLYSVASSQAQAGGATAVPLPQVPAQQQGTAQTQRARRTAHRCLHVLCALAPGPPPVPPHLGEVPAQAATAGPTSAPAHEQSLKQQQQHLPLLPPSANGWAVRAYPSSSSTAAASYGSVALGEPGNMLVSAEQESPHSNGWHTHPQQQQQQLHELSWSHQDAKPQASSGQVASTPSAPGPLQRKWGPGGGGVAGGMSAQPWPPQRQLKPGGGAAVPAATSVSPPLPLWPHTQPLDGNGEVRVVQALDRDENGEVQPWGGEVRAAQPWDGEGLEEQPWDGDDEPTALQQWRPHELSWLLRAMARTGWLRRGAWRAGSARVLAAARAGELLPSDASATLWAIAEMRRLGFLAPPDLPPADDLTLLMDRVHTGAQTLAPRVLAQALHSCGSLRHRPPPNCLDGLLDEGLRRRASEWRARDVAAALWALGALRAPPAAPALAAMLRCAETDARGLAGGAQLAPLLWALGVLRRAPPGAWMQHCLWQVQRRLSACDARSVAVVAAALARLRYRPHPAWAAALLRAARQRIFAAPTPPPSAAPAAANAARVAALVPMVAEDGDGQIPPAPLPMPLARQQGAEASLTPLAAAGMGRGALLGQVPGGAAPSLPRCPAREMELARPQRPMRASPPLAASSIAAPSGPQPAQQPAAAPPQQPAATQSPPASSAPGGSARRGSGASPQTLAMFLWALARLQLPPRAGYLRGLLAGMAPALRATGPRDLAVTLWALQRLGHVPDPTWAAAALAVLRARLPGACAVSTLTAMRALGEFAPALQVDGATLEALCQRLEHHLPALTPQQAACAAAALASMCGGAAAARQRACAPHALCQVGPPQQVVWRARAAPVPPPATLCALRRRLEELLPVIRVRDACHAVLAMARLAVAAGRQDGGALAAALTGQAVVSAATGPAEGLGRSGQAGDGAQRQQQDGNSGVAGGPALLPALLQLVRARPDSCTLQDLAQAAEACSTLLYHPGRDWLAAHEAHACRLVAGGAPPTQGLAGAQGPLQQQQPSPGELALLFEVYEALGYNASRLRNVADGAWARMAAAVAAARQASRAGAGGGGAGGAEQRLLPSAGVVQWQSAAGLNTPVAACSEQGQQQDQSGGAGEVPCDERGLDGGEVSSEHVGQRQRRVATTTASSKRQRARRREHQALWRL